jgi:hypothetical protein
MSGSTVFDPTDKGTLRPNEAPIYKVGTCFKPMNIEYRATEITLPNGVSPLRPYELFELYYTPEIIGQIVQATNNYARSIGTSERSRGKDWYDTTAQEIYVYLAIRIYMTLHIENEVSDYWGISNIGAKHPIVTMNLSVERFQELHMRYRVGEVTTTPYTRVSLNLTIPTLFTYLTIL